MNSQLVSVNLLVEMIAQSAHGLWQQDDFRSLVNFSQIPQAQQDRIFNELEVTILGLMILHIDDQIIKTKSAKQRLYLTDLQQEIIDGFLSLMSSIGIEKKLLKVWDHLIKMRLKEYRQNQTVFLKEMKANKVKIEPNIEIMFARAQSLSIDALYHIRNGEVQADDPLWKMLKEWLAILDI